MAVPTYATPLERIWHYAYLVICGLIFFFLIAPIVVIIPLSFNAEPYFTFTDRMLSFDPEGYSTRWYESLLTFGMQNPDATGWAFWSDAWSNANWIKAAKNSIIIGVFSTILATVLGTLQLFYFGTYLPHRRPDTPDMAPHHARTQPRNHLWAMLSCYFFGYHWEHHQSPGTPWWRLWRVKEARARETAPGAEGVTAGRARTL